MSARTLGVAKSPFPHLRNNARYESAVLAYSPLVYLRMSDVSGRYAPDISGFGRQGTVAGAPAAGSTVMPSGAGSLTLTSAGKYIGLIGPTWMAPAAWTVMAWIRLAAVSSYQNICNRDGSSSLRGWNFYVTSGKLNGFEGADHLGATTLSSATAYFVAMTFDGTSGKLFLNGAQDGSTFTPGAPFTTVPTSNDLWIGSSPAGAGTLPGSFSLNGDLDHFAMMPSAMTVTQLAGIYASA